MRKYLSWAIAGFLIALISIIPLRLAIAAHQAPLPQAIFVLGGNPERETAAAQIARHYPQLEVWVSSGSYPHTIETVFQEAGVSTHRLHLDYHATDTVTNFTTLMPTFQAREFQHLWLVTSDFHMPRARAIATVILGSHGITYTPHAVPSKAPPESRWRLGRDVARATLWLITGRTGATFAARQGWDQ